MTVDVASRHRLNDVACRRIGFWPAAGLGLEHAAQNRAGGGHGGDMDVGKARAILNSIRIAIADLPRHPLPNSALTRS